MVPSPVLGYLDCHQDAECECDSWNIAWCEDLRELAVGELEAELSETLAAIKANNSIPADGRFFYVKRGTEFVVRSKCDGAEMARLAIAEVESAPTLVGG